MDNAIRERYFTELEQENASLIDHSTGLLKKDISKVINCPLCGKESEEHKLLFVKNGYTFVRCSSCGMVFVNPQVDEMLLKETYTESGANDIWVELQASETEQKWKRDYYLDAIGVLVAYCNEESARLLDIGCSTGYFMQIAQETKPSWQIKGIELSEKAFAHAKVKGLDVEQKLLKELDNSQKFDVFTLFGVLEHVGNPRELLEDIKKHATDKALTMAIVPNVYSLYHMFLQERSRSFDGRNHLLYFSAKTLSRLFEDAGFRVISLDTVLTGLDAIRAQAQWYDPYTIGVTYEYLPDKVSDLLKSGEIERFLLKNDLGLRLRILASCE